MGSLPSPLTESAVLSVVHGGYLGRRQMWTVLPATAHGVTEARHALAAWLVTLGWPPPASEDILLAVNEALANVVDHAYPRPAAGQPTGQAQLYVFEVTDNDDDQARRVVAVVTDYGRWKTRALDQRYRAWGLATMTACMDSVRIDPSPGGTTVIMTSAPARPGPGRED
jgi:serine/threonine-protein kinase RsbW